MSFYAIIASLTLVGLSVGTPKKESIFTESFGECLVDTARTHVDDNFASTVKDILKNAPEAVQSNEMATQMAIGFGYPTGNLMNVDMNPLSDADLEQKKKAVEQVCARTFPGIPFCSDGFFAREENLREFLKEHQGFIQNTANKIQTLPTQITQQANGAFWNGAIGGTDFRPSKNETFWNLRIGSHTTLNRFDMGLMELVHDAKGNPVGVNFAVSVQGQQQCFLAPFIRQNEQVTVYNPYFFIFGGKSANEWNRYFRGVYGELDIKDNC